MGRYASVRVAPRAVVRRGIEARVGSSSCTHIAQAGHVAICDGEVELSEQGRDLAQLLAARGQLHRDSEPLPVGRRGGGGRVECGLERLHGGDYGRPVRDRRGRATRDVHHGRQVEP